MSWVRCRHGAGVVAVLAGALLAGCDTNDGRALRPPPPGATVPTTALASAPTTAEGAVLGTTPGPSDLLLSSPDFIDGGALPAQYAACGGDNVSPPLHWSGIPAGTVEMALVVTDTDVPDGGFIHWVVTGLSPDLIGLGPGAVPEGAVEARNDTSEFGWFGPCPPDGETHRYVFTLYALTGPTGIALGAGGPEAIDAITSIPGVAATLTATYAVP
jgi:Raf kinase inhibitor-like YbhB/YbcL family protein